MSSLAPVLLALMLIAVVVAAVFVALDVRRATRRSEAHAEKSAREWLATQEPGYKGVPRPVPAACVDVETGEVTRFNPATGKYEKTGETRW